MKRFLLGLFAGGVIGGSLHVLFGHVALSVAVGAAVALLVWFGRGLDLGGLWD